ncbi:MAG TPA: DUF2442 domain-containing protein [Pyrinomonadaceae bacterium]|nr:DUF2442 domain-containing protein [Pyrinomonadaceae bacterium]HMP67044.1 DUF2442 domain-containing protein [Pyrinomonadaceae bacterium]
MSTLTLEPMATSLSFDADNMWVQLSDGRQLGIPLAYFPRLAAATPSQRKNYLISGGGAGLHWEELDEDISVSALLAGRMDRTSGAKDPVKQAA